MSEKNKSLNLIILVLCMLLGYQTVFSQYNGWESINPLPTSRNINSVAFVNESLGYIGTDEHVYRTTDGGESWMEADNLQGTKSMSFFNNVGYSTPAYSSWGNVMRTTDGGLTWSTVTLYAQGSFVKVQVLSASKIIITTTQQIVYTTNGGEDWSYRYVPSCCSATSFFHDDLSGVVATANGKIFKTDDAGLSWDTTFDESNLSSAGFTSVSFSNALTGYAGSTSWDELYKTTDGGATWYPVEVGISFQIKDIEFLDEQTGFASAEYGKVYKTVDGGLSWTSIAPTLLFNSSSNLKSICVINENKIVTVGNLGRILRTEDGGVNWNINSNLFRDIRHIEYASDLVGYVIGHFDVYKTTNGGFDWEMVRQHVTNAPVPKFITFLNEDVGLIGCVGQSYSRYYRTTDGGSTWTQLPQPNPNYDQISFLGFNEAGVLFTSTYYGTNTYSKTYKSSDMGQTWIEIYNEPLYQLNFTSPQVIYALKTYNGARKVVKSDDGGGIWTEILDLEGQSIMCYHFYTSEVGYLIAKTNNITSLHKTIDGGITWSISSLPTDLEGRNFREMIFTDENQGYVMDNDGIIFQTSDGGDNWSSLNVAYGGLSVHSQGNYLFVGGPSGNLWRRILPAVVSASDLDTKATAMTIYPNPTNDIVNLKFTKTNQPHTIKLSDSLGRILRTATQMNNENSFSWNVSELAQGVYFITIESENITEITKLIIR